MGSGGWKTAQDKGAELGRVLANSWSWPISTEAVDVLSDQELLHEADHLELWIER